VLNEAGEGGRKINLKPNAERPIDSNEYIQAAVAQMEGQGEYSLAGLLRSVAERRKAVAVSTKKSRK